ncbi:Tim44 domain-containing protein [Massilia horti]|uniref:Tim44-like domain-containing protein n=1 Tax=Massilia horti TaxID=2562153 RepID=A0A4Y9SZI8_9BURK|nr:TIM44-like domain-containing protein [Massilia horti]TFW30789.1 hypothetical protein E4O92_15770 [Massilia horti]
MKKFLVGMMLAVTALSLVTEAIARPMGGGRSFGRQSQSVRQMSKPAPAPAPAQQQSQMQRQATPGQAAPAPMPQQKPSMWKGMLGGALLGLGLGALLSHFGIGGAMASMLSSILMIVLLALAVMFIVRMFRRKDTPANPSYPMGVPGTLTPASASATPEIGSGLSGYQSQPNAFQGQSQAPSSSAAPHVAWGVPSDFDTDAFLRQAKSMFIRLQATWDRGDVADLREFTTPEVFAELKTQIMERTGNDFTDVVSIDAQLLGIDKTEQDYLASVQFNGMIKSAPNAQPEPFVEVWNLSKPQHGTGGWVLAGIQQVA